MAGANDQVAAEYARLQRDRRRGRRPRVERRVALTAVLVLCAVPLVMLGNIVSTFRLFEGTVESPQAIRTYEVLLVVSVVAFLIAMVFGARTARKGVLVVALTMVPIVLVAGYVCAVPQGRWSGGYQAPGRDVPACYSGTDSCAEYGG